MAQTSIALSPALAWEHSVSKPPGAAHVVPAPHRMNRGANTNRFLGPQSPARFDVCAAFV
jgi:hypothetical protein